MKNKLLIIFLVAILLLGACGASGKADTPPVPKATLIATIGLTGGLYKFSDGANTTCYIAISGYGGGVSCK